jgi:hypothetical protein
MSVYKITNNQEIHEILPSPNEDNFTMAVELFRLFDNSRINLDSTIDELRKFPNDFTIRFYPGNVHEFIVNPFQLACVLGTEKMVKILLKENRNQINNTFVCGTCQHTTPLVMIINNGWEKILENYQGTFDFDVENSHGEKLISQESKNKIIELQKYKKELLDGSIPKVEELITNWRPFINEPELLILKEFLESVVSKTEFQDGRKVLCIQGKGNTGKTTLVKEIMKIVGHRAKNVPSFEEITDTCDCDLVIIQEFMNDDKEMMSANIKKMTSKDFFCVRRSPNEDGTQYLNTAKLLFTIVLNNDFDTVTNFRIVTINLTHVF